MSKRIYVAAPWVARATARDFAHTLMAFGYEITMDWWNYESKEHGFTKGSPEHSAFLCMCGERDLRGVRTADAVVLINSAKSEGKAVEQGIALALGLPIVAIGQVGEFTQNVFHYLSNYHWVADYEDALDKLKELFGEQRS